MKSKKRILLIFLVILLCTASDQLTKKMVRSSLSRTTPLTLINGMVSLDYAENKGGVFAFE